MKNNLMLKSAIWYAQHGWYVLPIHEPVFVNGVCVGCTCEPYRHSDECKRNNPRMYLAEGEKCDNPGKCPRVRWGEKSTTDIAQITKWWSIWQTANVGIDCGKSGLLVFDADTYKDTYGDLSEILSSEDRETVTVITGGGGEHFIYDRQDKPYGNSTRNLPAGIDIRGVGGYIVAAPSLHKSGNRYQYEEGYKPNQIKPLPIPSKLNAILATHTIAHTTHLPTQPAQNKEIQFSIDVVHQFLDDSGIQTFGEQAYGLGRRWSLCHCPFNPQDNPHAEDGAAFICVLNDARIVAGCHHNRCRQAINTEENGWRMLKAVTGITNAGKTVFHRNLTDAVVSRFFAMAIGSGV